MNKPFFLLALIAICSSAVVQGQLTTINPDSKKTLNRGLYKSYEEFITNAPSDKEAFSVTPVYLNKKDSSSIIGGTYQLTDSSNQPEQRWGFCDGHTVFITAAPLTFRYYWKLICLGKYPFFLGKSRSLMTLRIRDLIAGNVFNTRPKNLALLVITESGRFKEVDIAYLKKILAARPALLADFRRQADQYEQYDNPNADQVETEEAYQEKIKIMIDYLIKLNQSMQY